ncbi:hypothetical protein AJ78_07121 [Emergomyces pasteurianus Ep9510]|uniref:Uncharacterized protein n=1 Tax=Emergomyces pasteurianus Ep9510 TaxID=1447872 RepID=A0A1J9PWJ0_9EURO|nr:hypothetical protein AJ78_07121 [Emergomyces pasteurianus Ep9510]
MASIIEDEKRTYPSSLHFPGDLWYNMEVSCAVRMLPVDKAIQYQSRLRLRVISWVMGKLWAHYLPSPLISSNTIARPFRSSCLGHGLSGFGSYVSRYGFRQYWISSSPWPESGIEHGLKS